MVGAPRPGPPYARAARLAKAALSAVLAVRAHLRTRRGTVPLFSLGGGALSGYGCRGSSKVPSMTDVRERAAFGRGATGGARLQPRALRLGRLRYAAIYPPPLSRLRSAASGRATPVLSQRVDGLRPPRLLPCTPAGETRAWGAVDRRALTVYRPMTKPRVSVDDKRGLGGSARYYHSLA